MAPGAFAGRKAELAEDGRRHVPRHKPCRIEYDPAFAARWGSGTSESGDHLTDPIRRARPGMARQGLTMKYDLAIFDFDGTLADSFPFLVSVVNALAHKHDFQPIDFREIEKLRAYDAMQMLRHVGLPLWKMPLVGRSYLALMAKSVASIPLFPGVNELLRGLKANGITAALVTSNSDAIVRQVLGPENTALIAHFHCGVSMFGKRHKLHEVLRKAHCDRSRAIYIGDEARDLQAAKSEHIAFGAVSWGFNSVESLMALSPQEVFARVEDIVPRLA
jgi:phosphoglycolate phosphatase